MPKRLPLGPTKSKILEYLLFERRTAAEVSAHLRIQVSAVRKHLDRLREMGIVEEDFVRAGPGRPKKMYSLTAAGRELLPRRYAAVLSAVLDHLVRERGPAYAESVMNGVASTFVRSIGRVRNRSPGEMERLAAGLSDFGFKASVEERDGSYVITSRNCPILLAAETHREIACAGLHGELIRLGAAAPDVRRDRWILEGSPFCTHVFPKDSGGAT